MGKHFDELPARALLDFLYAQQVQSPLILEAGWLIVGHVDEFVQFLPYDNDLGFTISIADTESAISLLKDLEANGHGNTRASSYESSSEVTLYEPSLNLTITELLSNTTFITANAYAQRHLDANLQTLLSEIPLDPSDIIRIPTLFRDSNFPFDMSQGINGLPGRVSPTLAGERKLMSFFPASINGIVLGERYIGPRSWGPVVNGTDVLAKAVEGAYARAGMSVRWIDDFLSHHVWGGEVHCGSNTLR
jgi:protein-arginine deiminase